MWITTIAIVYSVCATVYVPFAYSKIYHKNHVWEARGLAILISCFWPLFVSGLVTGEAIEEEEQPKEK
jgi:hypothetical protein